MVLSGYDISHNVLQWPIKEMDVIFWYGCIKILGNGPFSNKVN